MTLNSHPTTDTIIQWGESLRWKRAWFDFFVGVVVLAVLSGCGRGSCFNQAQCPDGSWGSGSSDGTLGSFLEIAKSLMHRPKTSTQLTLSEELALGTAALPVGYRKVPLIGNSVVPTPGDDDGYLGGATTYSTRPTLACGTTQATIAARIAHCAQQNPLSASWIGSVNGNSGQSDWKLVTYNLTHEVWRDERTTLLWSDRLGATNWCRASGSSGGGPFAETDQYSICDNIANQSQVTPESWCTEDPGLDTPGAYDSMKGGIRFVATSSSPAVVWRLPTVWDYHQAEIDGIRSVLPNLAGNVFWTATLNSSTRNVAYNFWGDSGSVSDNTRTTLYSVRCVGR